MSLIEQIRAVTVRHVLSLPTFVGHWPRRKRLIRSTFANPRSPTRQELVGLGNHLSAIFSNVPKKKRTNRNVAKGGAVWSALVTWYLNICYAGTDAIVFCGGKNVPKALKDAMSINYQNSSLRSDSDVIVLSYPGLHNEGNQPSEAACHRRLAEIVEADFGRCGMVNLQCKTNWNENAQIPMLWNMVFEQSRAPANPTAGFLVGSNGFHLRNLGFFSYAFVTVPTSSGGPTGFSSNKMEVKRVAALSGGAYWGHPTKVNVCRSITEFFGHQFSANGVVMPNVSKLGIGYVSSLTAPSPSFDTAAFGIA